MTELNQITLVQSPVIAHRLAEVGKQVDERIAALNIEKQIATVETVKTLKELRVDLNKELAEFEEQRKLVKSALMNPYNEMESLYKVQISEKYNSAINMLKDKIASVENQIKSDKIEVLRSYFAELCCVENIDFVEFNRVVPEVLLSTSEKQYKKQIVEFIDHIKDDLALIATTGDIQAEVLTEFKVTLNAAKAITTIQERKEKEAKEAAELAAKRKGERIEYLKKIGLVYVDMTDSYEYSAEIFATMQEIEQLSTDDFRKKIAEIEQAIKKPEATPEKKAPITAPKVEQTAKMMTASFKVTGTREQLLKLGAFMKENGITYQNL